MFLEGVCKGLSRSKTAFRTTFTLLLEHIDIAHWGLVAVVFKREVWEFHMPVNTKFFKKGFPKEKTAPGNCERMIAIVPYSLQDFHEEETAP